MFVELVYYSTYQFLVRDFIIGVRFDQEKGVHAFFSMLPLAPMFGRFANKYFKKLEVIRTTPKCGRMKYAIPKTLCMHIELSN